MPTGSIVDTEISGTEALAEMLEYLAKQLRAGTVTRFSIESTADSHARVTAVFKTNVDAELPTNDGPGD